MRSIIFERVRRGHGSVLCTGFNILVLAPGTQRCRTGAIPIGFNIHHSGIPLQKTGINDNDLNDTSFRSDEP
jgi:hypothetical protein